MAYGLEILARIEKVNITHEVALAANNHAKDMEDAIKKQLYEKGEDGTGKPLKPYNNYLFEFDGRIVNYPDLKHEMNPQVGYGTPDLFFTGNYYENIYVDVSPAGEVQSGSTDSKEGSLSNKYGNAITKISEGSAIELWNNQLHPDVVKQVSELTGIK